MKVNLLKKISVCLLLIALLTSLFVLWQRCSVERNSDNIEIALDYQNMIDFVHDQHYSLEYVLQKMKKAGATTLAISEKTLEDLERQGKLSIVSDPDLKKLSLLTGNPPLYEGGDTYILTNDRTVYEQVNSSLVNKFGSGKVKDFSQGDDHCLAVSIPTDVLKEIPLYLDNDDMMMAESLGYVIMPRFCNYSKANSENIVNEFMQLNGYEKITSVAFLEEEALGYNVAKDFLKTTAETMKKYNLTPAVIEFCDQKGMQTLLGKMNNSGVRLHSIPEEELKEMDLRTAKLRYIRAVKERNIKIVYMRMMTGKDALKGKDPLAVNLGFVTSLKSSLQKAGYTVGMSKPFTPYSVGIFPVILISLGALAGLMFLITFFYPRVEVCVGVGAVGVVVLLGLLVTGHLELGRKVMALLASMVFPTLAVLQMLKGNSKRKPYNSFIVAVLWSLLGGVFVATLLADTSFFLKINSFSGVKLMHLMPLVLVSVYYCFYVCNKEKSNWLEKAKEYLDQPVLIKYVILAGIVMIAGVIYILRTGNEIGPLQVSPIEIRVRELLETILVARPRTSEFLLGHPAFILASAYLSRNWGLKLFPLVLLATIGQISIVSTFTHVHTPFLFSFLRVSNGTWIGLLIGYALLCLLNLGERWWQKNE